MRSKLLNEAPEKTHALILDAGDEVVSSLTAFAREQSLAASRFSAIGAFSRLTLGYFLIERQDYERIEITEQVEVLALLGDLVRSESGDDFKAHAHVVVGKRDGTAHGGHLLAATVRPTLEIMLVESPAYLRRVHDPRFGIALIRPEA